MTDSTPSRAPARAPAPASAPAPATTPGRDPFSLGPLPFDLFDSWWPSPARPKPWIFAAAAAAGVVAALVLPYAERLGLGVTLYILAAAVPVAVLARRNRGVVDHALGALALGLGAVVTVRASVPMAVLCMLAAFGLAVVAVLGVRTWAAVVAAVPLFGIATLRSLLWSSHLGRNVSVRRVGPWVSGSLFTAVVAACVGALLSSADAAFAKVVGALVPSVDLGQVPESVISFGVGAVVVLAAAFAVSTTLSFPEVGLAPRRAHPAEWALPLAGVGAVIGAFLAVEATALFGGAEVVLAGTSVTPAERAREGFGQLTVVTLLVLALLSWAARKARPGPPQHRRLFGVTGGALAAMTLVLTWSALHRMSLYQEAFGWSVLRVLVASFELWVAAVLVGIAVAWWLRRTDVVPRLVIGSAGAGLLALSLAGPDALVARANVARFEETGKIDTSYLSQLSDDAVPALQRLPEPERSCVLALRELEPDAWYEWNLARSAARDSLAANPAGVCQDPPR